MKKLVIFAIFVSLYWQLFSCDMFALIATGENSISYSDTISGEFNDPYDYFTFLKGRSTETLQDDGYGICVYDEINHQEIGVHFWYKTGLDTWYNDGNPDFIEEAIEYSMNDDSNIKLILAHARNGSGGNGSHPFWVEVEDKTYTFMHNGAFSDNIKMAIMEFLGETWFIENPSNWEGVYGDVDSFIDSELFFHYLLFFILQDELLPNAIVRACNQTNIEGINIQNIIFSSQFYFNFILSDGENLYVFRNSPQNNTHFNVSYKRHSDFIAIKTHDSLQFSVNQYDLLEIIPDSINVHQAEEPRPVEVSLLHAQQENSTIHLFWQTHSETDNIGWNIFRGTTSDSYLYDSVISLNSELIPLSNDIYPHDYFFSDEYNLQTNSTYYYWIEGISSSGNSSIFGPISNLYIYDEPDPPLIPSVTQLFSNYPNPFEQSTSFRFQIAENSAYFSIYNIKGQKVFSETLSSGFYENYLPDINQFPSGIYFYRLRTDHYKKISLMIKIK